jgi:hypothetical protein
VKLHAGFLGYLCGQKAERAGEAVLSGSSGIAYYVGEYITSVFK